jgi:hypothetical protein
MTQKDAVLKVFNEYAGKGKEVGWEELKKILGKVMIRLEVVL